MDKHDTSLKIARAEIITTWPGLLSVDLTAKFLSIGKTLLHQLDVSGRIPQAIHLHGRKLWRRCELERWIAHGCPSRECWEYEGIQGKKDER